MTSNNNQSNNEPKEPEPERPLECTECRRPIAFQYTEIVGDRITHTCMCAECPVLHRRLHGTHLEHAVSSDSATSLACGNCGTTLDAIRVGTLLGCQVCYEVFDDILLPEMLEANKIPARFATTTKKSVPVHIGRAPGEIQEINPSLRLLALNEALTEMLKSEKYEQAAWLRDQIKALTDEREGDNLNQENSDAEQ